MRNACGKCCTKIEDVSVHLNRHAILEHVNAHFHCGEMNVIVGPNGAGKSTLLKVLLNMIPYSGAVRFTDEEMKRIGVPVIGYVPQTLEFDTSGPMTVLDLFASCRSRRPVWMGVGRGFSESVRENLERIEAASLLHKRLGSLSGGELRRVLLALALDPMPDLLLLDEPEAGMDKNGLTRFYELLCEIREQYDLSVVMVSHDFSLSARYADRMLLLNGKVLKTGTPAEVLESEPFIELFGPGYAGMLDKSLKREGKA